MKYAVIVVLNTKIGDAARIVLVKVVLCPWWGAEGIHYIFTERLKLQTYASYCSVVQNYANVTI